MAYYRTCPECGAHLDPGEACSDCEVSDETTREVQLEGDEVQPAYSN